MKTDKLPTWRIHITPLGSHAEGGHLYDLDAEHKASRTEIDYEVEISADTALDLCRANLLYEVTRTTLPADMIEDVIGDVTLTFPSGRTWTGSFKELLGSITQMAYKSLAPVIAAIENLEAAEDARELAHLERLVKALEVAQREVKADPERYRVREDGTTLAEVEDPSNAKTLKAFQELKDRHFGGRTPSLDELKALVKRLEAQSASQTTAADVMTGAK